MNVKQLIEYLEKKDPDMVAPMGFANPHSYRRYYACLAFEPVQNITIGAMLDYVIKAHGSTYQGLDGLEYRMNRDTEVYLAIEGRTGEKIGTVLLDYMTGVYDGEECESLRGVISRSTDEIAGLIADRNNVQTDLKSADSKLFEYRVQIVDQSKAIHDLIVEKAQVGRAIDAMCSTISEQNKEINELGHRNENQMGSIQYQRKILKELTEEKTRVVQDIEAMTGTISEQNQALLHIKAELDAAKQFNPFDLMLISGSMENISNIVEDHFTSEPTTDEWDGGIIELRSWVGRLSSTVETLEAELKSVKSDRDIRDDIIEGKIVTISQLKNRVEGQENILQSWQEEIEDLKTEVDRLRGIIRTEHDYNTDLLESNKLKFHKIEALKAELSACKEDSEVLMKVVEIVKEDKMMCGFTLNAIADLLVDYTDIPEVEVIE